jgi:hypothetical protein
MERAKKLIACLKSFNKWSIGGSSTQVTATASEDFCEQCVKKSYPNSKIYKMGSQQHPDFMIVPIEYENLIEEFSKSIRSRKITLGVLKKWEASKYNKNKIRIVRLEIKTGASVYTLNDTFPNPLREKDEIYVLFSIGEQKVYVTTSSTMAEKCQTNPPIEKRFEASKKAVSDFGSHLKKIWDGIGISTAARPTYRMDRHYAHHEANAERLSEIFAEAGF